MNEFKSFLQHKWSGGTKFLLNFASFIGLVSLLGGVGLAIWIIGLIVMKELAK